jgi:uncharacterized protein (DUF433 family)
MPGSSLYGGQDPREMPAYAIAEAAHYLLLPPSTLRDWVKGRSYPTQTGTRDSTPLIALPPRALDDPLALSFFNVVEAHVLGALRRHHRVSMWKVRQALTFLAAHSPSDHPLADQDFATDGVSLFLENYGPLINLTHEGQLAMRDVLQMFLRRIDRDAAGIPVKLYLFTRTSHADAAMTLAEAPRRIVIDPYVSFGRPVLAGTGIPTAIIAERYKGGESIEDLATDYARPSLDIQEAIRCELLANAA